VHNENLCSMFTVSANTQPQLLAWPPTSRVSRETSSVLFPRLGPLFIPKQWFPGAASTTHKETRSQVSRQYPSSVPSDPMPSSTRPSPLSSPLSKNGPHATHGPSTRPVLVRKRFPSTLSRRRLTSPHLTRPTVSSFLHSIFSVPSSLTRRPSTHLPSSRASSRMQWICTYPGPTTPLCAMYPA